MHATNCTRIENRKHYITLRTTSSLDGRQRETCSADVTPQRNALLHQSGRFSLSSKRCRATSHENQYYISTCSSIDRHACADLLNTRDFTKSYGNNTLFTFLSARYILAMLHVQWALRMPWPSASFENFPMEITQYIRARVTVTSEESSDSSSWRIFDQN